MLEDDFEATCESCGDGVMLTALEQDELIGENGSYRCPSCATPSWLARLRPRVRRPRIDPWRRAGCIVTAGYPDGSSVSFVREGVTADEALRLIVAELPLGSWVESICTYRSIRRDLEGPRRDPWSVERAMLGRIGRSDLLPPKARSSR